MVLLLLLFLLLLARCGRAETWEMAIALLHESRRRGPHPTASVYLAAAHACAIAGKWQEGSDLLEASEMK